MIFFLVLALLVASALAFHFWSEKAEAEVVGKRYYKLFDTQTRQFSALQCNYTRLAAEHEASKRRYEQLRESVAKLIEELPC